MATLLKPVPCTCRGRAGRVPSLHGRPGRGQTERSRETSRRSHPARSHPMWRSPLQLAIATVKQEGGQRNTNATEVATALQDQISCGAGHCNWLQLVIAQSGPQVKKNAPLAALAGLHLEYLGDVLSVRKWTARGSFVRSPWGCSHGLGAGLGRESREVGLGGGDWVDTFPMLRRQTESESSWYI